VLGLRRGALERTPLVALGRWLQRATRDGGEVGGRGLHSFTSQPNLSAFNGTGGARRGCVARVKGLLGVV
jgi:hypothetical protein